MSSSRDFADHCCELLSSLGPCVAKRMFGGFGISIEGMSVAIIADLGGGEKLWLKGDEAARPRYEAAHCARFTYEATTKQGTKELKSMNYFSAPEDAMDSREAMQPWAQLALECALKARSAQNLKKNKPLARTRSAQSAPKTRAKAPAKAAPAKRSSRKA
jgi:DNA transformation protein and related proteins